MAIKKVALVGAGGNLGPAVLAALQASGLEVTVLSRASSKSSFSAPTKTVPDDFPEAALTEALAGFDALVATIPGGTAEAQMAMASAAASAGLTRFIPADFGSVDSTDEVCVKLLPLYRKKAEVRAHCQRLAEQHAGFSWTSLVTGHFFDHGLKAGLLGIELRSGKATVFDDGEKKWSATTTTRIGDAVVRVLTDKFDETRNRMVYIQSFCVSQLDIVTAIMSTSGRQMDVEFKRSQDYIDEKKKKVDEGDRAAVEELVGVLGLTRANWESNPDFINPLLGYDSEDLEEVLKAVYMSYVPKFSTYD